MQADHARDPRGRRGDPRSPHRLPRAAHRIPERADRIEDTGQSREQDLSPGQHTPFTVSVIDEVGYEKLDEQRATELCAAAFSERGLDLDWMGEVSIALVETEVIRDLNEQFRGKDAPTDVLSFEVDGPYGEMVGEIVISPGSMSPEMSVEELVVHGALHLSGMDHGEDFEASEMARVQKTVMETAGG